MPVARCKSVCECPWRPALVQRIFVGIMGGSVAVSIPSKGSRKIGGPAQWDADWEMGDLFMDESPEVARHLKEFLRIEDDYFTDIAPDPTDEQIWFVR